VTGREVRALTVALAAFLAGLAAALFLALPGGAEGLQTWRVLAVVRLPEALTAALVGGALGLSGLLFQLVLRNSLADPYVLGVAGGSTLAMVAALLAAGASATVAGLSVRAAAAFLGGLLSLAAILKLGAGKPSTLLLAGIVANTAFAAAARVLTAWFSPAQLAQVTTVLIGFIPTPPLWEPLLLVPLVAFVLGRFLVRGRGLDLLLLSDDEGASLGLAVGKVRREALVLATLLGSAAVALCGMIGFVGLVVPHAARLTAGRRHRVLVPASFLLGGAFLLLAHGVGKLLADKWLLPVGVTTSLVGAPVFLALLARSARREWT
jgi:iron complex transport system permease protein